VPAVAVAVAVAVSVSVAVGVAVKVGVLVGVRVGGTGVFVGSADGTTTSGCGVAVNISAGVKVGGSGVMLGGTGVTLAMTCVLLGCNRCVVAVSVGAIDGTTPFFVAVSDAAARTEGVAVTVGTIGDGATVVLTGRCTVGVKLGVSVLVALGVVVAVAVEAT